MVGVAVDIQGPTAAGPWYRKQKLTYPTLVDPGNALGRVIGYTIVPNQFYVDELGVFHGLVDDEQLAKKLAEPMREVPKGLGERLRHAAPELELAALLMKAASATDEFAVQLAAGNAALSAGDHRIAVKHFSIARDLNTGSAEALTSLAYAFLGTNEKSAAASALRSALKIEPDNWLIHKQIWAIEYPEKFYEGPVDFRWQREQLRRERSAE